MPERQRRCGGCRVTSSPRNRTRPASARKSPLMRLNSVVLPAPLGPRMPSVSPRVTDNEMPSVTLSAPKLLLTFSSASIATVLLLYLPLRLPSGGGEGRGKVEGQEISLSLPPAGMLGACELLTIT